MNRHVTITRAAAAWGITRSTAYRRIHSGQIAAVRDRAGMWWIPVDEIERWKGLREQRPRISHSGSDRTLFDPPSLHRSKPPRMAASVPPDHMTAPDAARALGVQTQAIYRYIRAGSMDAAKVGPRTWMIPRAEVERWKRNTTREVER
jgi:excisionase family DNA binding protein